MESASIKQEQHQSCSPLRPPRIEPRPPHVEPLLSIKKPTTKDIKREQQRFEVKAPTLPKPKPMHKEPSTSKSVETTKCTGSFKVLTHSLIKIKRCYYYKCKVGECKASFNRIKSWNIHHLVKHKSMKYKCSKSNKTMPTPSSYRDHLNLHKDTKFTCNKWDQKFVYECGLKLHKNLHR